MTTDTLVPGTRHHLGGAPLILGIGGTNRPGSSSERALRFSLAAAEQAGARTEIITAEDLVFGIYDPDVLERSDSALHFLDAVRRSDGIIIASPGYHASLSGLLKNALDYLQDLAEDPEPYLHNRAVGCIVSAFGAKASAGTLLSLQNIVHALRGWPTPMGVAITSSKGLFDEDGNVLNSRIASQLAIVGRQVAQFALLSRPLLV